MSRVKSEVNGYQLVETDTGNWLVRTPDGEELMVTSNKVKFYADFVRDPEMACSVHCS